MDIGADERWSPCRVSLPLVVRKLVRQPAELSPQRQSAALGLLLAQESTARAAELASSPQTLGQRHLGGHPGIDHRGNAGMAGHGQNAICQLKVDLVLAADKIYRICRCHPQRFL